VAAVARLVVVRGPLKDLAFDLEERPYTIGRSTECDITLPDPSVSRCHARILPAEGGFRIEDADSRHGTYVGERRVRAFELESGCLLHVGNVSLRFLVCDTEATTADSVEPRPEESAPAAVAFDVLDQLHLAVLLVAPDGRVLLGNRSARTILEAGDGLGLSHSELRVQDRTACESLRRLLAAPPRSGLHALQVPRQAKRLLSLLVARLATGDPTLAAASTVFVCDPEREVRDQAETLIELYRLTPAESKVAEQLLRGSTLDEISLELGVSLNTVRTHLKRVLSKTETRRQSELVRLLFAGLAQVRPD